MTMCSECGVKRARTKQAKSGSVYANNFCSNSCFTKYSDKLISMFRSSEVEAQDEMQRNGMLDALINELDEAAATAAKGARDPQDIATTFIGMVAGKFATKIYGSLEDAARAWARRRADTAPDPEPPPSEAKTQTTKPTHTQPRKSDEEPEPANLDQLPIKIQRAWLVKRFRKLKPDATRAEIKTEYLRLCKECHPDRGGSQRKMALLNSTWSRIQEIDQQLDKKKGAKAR